MNTTKRAIVTEEHKAEAQALRAIWERAKPSSQKEFGIEFGIGGQGAVSNFLAGTSALSLKAAAGFAQGLGCSIEDFSPRLAATAAQIADSMAESPMTARSLSPSPAPGMPVVHVPILANSASMGHGADQQHDDVIIGVLPLSETWMRRTLQPTNVKHVRFIHAYGDSMSPTFEDGDIVLVDTGMRDAKSIDGIYVIEANERLYIKRIRQRIDGEVEVSSDNPTVKTVDILNGDHPAMILGKVIYRWLGKKL